METNIEDKDQQKSVAEELEKTKRKCSSLDSVTRINGLAIADGVDFMEHPSPHPCSTFQLDQLSDEVLYEIFKSLDTWTLMALMNTCERFRTLVLDRRFWNHIDSTYQPLPLRTLEKVLKRTHGQTTIIKLRGPPAVHYVTGDFIKFSCILAISFADRCVNLRVLELVGVPIAFRQVYMMYFPKTLTRLILDNCSLHEPNYIKSIFNGINTHLTNLEELGIQNSDWFLRYYIPILSKAPKLRWLSLKGCSKIKKFERYGRLAASVGFKQLEHLDMRFTPITDLDLQCFNTVATLKEVLLDYPEKFRAGQAPTSAALDLSSPPYKRCKLMSTAAINYTPSTSPNASEASTSNDTTSISTKASTSKSNEAVISAAENMNDDTPSTSASAFTAAGISSSTTTSELPNVSFAPSTSSTSSTFISTLTSSSTSSSSFNNSFHTSTSTYTSSTSSIHGDSESSRGFVARPPRRTGGSISDYGIRRFGIRLGDNRFERLTVRNYSMITDISLRHLAEHSPFLVFLDLSGTSVTTEGVNHFKSLKPDCVVVAEHLQSEKNGVKHQMG